MAQRKNIMVNGVLTPVWQTDATAQEIDDTAKKTAWQCNPNLLDNWCFLPGCVVNQRGQTSYTGEIYGIDRWKGVWTGDGTATLVDNGLKLFRAGHPAHNLQYVEHPERLAGQVVTLSILAKNGYTAIVVNGAEQTFDGITSLGVKSNTITLPDPLTSLAVEVLSAADETDNLFLAVKLELGDTQTLAHKEGDTWVLNEIPDYGEQLRRCQRYFVKFPRLRFKTLPSNCIYPIVLPCQMRTIPTLSNNVKGNVVVESDFDASYVVVKNTADSASSDIIFYNLEISAEL